jgi:hypothetical protein
MAIALQIKHFDILQNCFQANKPAYLTLPPKKSHGFEGEEGDDALKDGKKKPSGLRKEGKIASKIHISIET